MKIILISILSYWFQTDWSGEKGVKVWKQDTNSYYMSEWVNTKLYPGRLVLFSCSKKWHPIEVSEFIKEINVIQHYDNQLYLGGGWDSMWVVKMEEEEVRWIKTLASGRVTGMLVLDRQTLLVGGENGKLFRGEDSNFVMVKEFGFPILSIYRGKSGPSIYLTVGNKVWVDEIGTGERWDYVEELKEVEEVFCVYETNYQKFFATTKMKNGKGGMFFSDYSGQRWEFLQEFEQTDAIYSMCEDGEGNLYVSSGYKGKIFTSKDSGKSWEEIPSPMIAEFYQIMCDEEEVLYLFGKKVGRKGFKGVGFMSRDKGESWDTIFYREEWHPTRIKTAERRDDDGIIFIGGDTNVIFKSTYSSKGELISSIYDVFGGRSDKVNKSLQVGRLSFYPEDERIKMRIRGSNYIDSMPEWGEVVELDSVPKIPNGIRYLQYKVELTTYSLTETPYLDWFCIRYTIDTLSPVIEGATFYEGEIIDTQVDDDDYVEIKFSEKVNTPVIGSENIDEILTLSNGHSWLSDSGRGILQRYGEWRDSSTLVIYLSTVRIGEGRGYPPTIEVGDTIYPDSFTIQDVWGSPVFSPVVITTPPTVEEREVFISNVLLKIKQKGGKIYIQYYLPYTMGGKLSIYDVVGRLKKTLEEGKLKKGWNQISIQNEELKNGVYFVHLTVGEETFSKKLVHILGK